MSDIESVMAEFVGELSEVIKRYWPKLAIEAGFTSAYMIMGALDQCKQKVLEDLNEELIRA